MEHALKEQTTSRDAYCQEDVCLPACLFFGREGKKGGHRWWPDSPQSTVPPIPRGTGSPCPAGWGPASAAAAGACPSPQWQLHGVASPGPARGAHSHQSPRAGKRSWKAMAAPSSSCQSQRSSSSSWGNNQDTQGHQGCYLPMVGTNPSRRGTVKPTRGRGGSAVAGVGQSLGRSQQDRTQLNPQAGGVAGTQAQWVPHSCGGGNIHSNRCPRTPTVMNNVIFVSKFGRADNIVTSSHIQMMGQKCKNQPGEDRY